MGTKPEILPAAVYFIADHLDAVLAAGEDLRKLSLSLSPATAGQGAGPAYELRSFVEKVQALELSMIARLIEARKRANDLDAPDKPLRLILKLFTSGTAALSDAVVECGDECLAQFHTAGDALDYLRARHLLAEDLASLKTITSLSVTEDMLIASRVPLHVIMDHAAMVLDALDLQFQLYEPEASSLPSEDATKPADQAPNLPKSKTIAEMDLPIHFAGLTNRDPVPR